MDLPEVNEACPLQKTKQSEKKNSRSSNGESCKAKNCSSIAILEENNEKKGNVKKKDTSANMANGICGLARENHPLLGPPPFREIINQSVWVCREVKTVRLSGYGWLPFDRHQCIRALCRENSVGLWARRDHSQI